MNRVSAAAATVPSARPRTVSRMPSRKTSRSAEAGEAPSAMRRPSGNQPTQRRPRHRAGEAESLLLSGIAVTWNSRVVDFLTTRCGSLYIDLAPDWRVLGLTAALAALATILFELAPALRATPTSRGAGMKATSRGITMGRTLWNAPRAAGGCAAVRAQLPQPGKYRSGIPAGRNSGSGRRFQPAQSRRGWISSSPAGAWWRRAYSPAWNCLPLLNSTS